MRVSLVCPHCGGDARCVDLRSKWVDRLFCGLRLKRHYDHCRACRRGCIPWDRTLGLSTARLTPAASEHRRRANQLRSVGGGHTSQALRTAAERIDGRARDGSGRPAVVSVASKQDYLRRRSVLGLAVEALEALDVSQRSAAVQESHRVHPQYYRNHVERMDYPRYAVCCQWLADWFGAGRERL